MVSARYIAYGVAGLLLFSVPDKFGRKWTLFVNFLIQVVAAFTMILVPTYEARLISFIFFGLCMLKVSVAYIYIAELVPAAYTTKTSVALTSFDSTTLMIINFYFLLVSRDWFPI
mmetsp:Transcript_10805/g.14541  ORF Transcript_10805/g.14541 Transcript_10805/m.14541 type:complete len:115 (+) Transcript_10805:500-844(+)